MKRSITALNVLSPLLVVIGISVGQAQAANNSITFNGKVINEPCTVSVGGTAGNAVDLGVTTTTLMTASGVTTKPVHFSIDLKGCSITDVGSALISFSGQPDDIDNSSVKNTGTATGMGVQIKDSNDTVVPIDGTSTGTLAKLNDGGDTSIDYTAYMIDVGGQAGVGSVTGSTTFVVNYQ